MNAAKQAIAKPSASRDHSSSRPSASVPQSGLQARLGNQNLQRLLRARLLQARLTVSDPHDAFEREAESVADQVMRTSDASLQGGARSPLQIQRACSQCQEELQRASTGEAPAVSDALEQSIGQLAGRGSPLPASVRSFMEPRFGADFSAVRVHTDAHAHGLARAVNAQAFTVGNNVVFGAGHYAPETANGKHLLAHELTHVVQQGAAGKIARRIDFQDQRERPGAAEFEEDAGQLVRGILKSVADAGIYVGAFLVGIVHGFLKSIWDAISGIAHMLYSVFKSVFLDQTFIADLKALAHALMSVTWQGIDDAVTGWSQEWLKKLESPSPFTSGEAHGYLTGYVMAEAAMLLVSGGTTAALKGAFWSSKVGMLIKGSRALRSMESALAKAARAANTVGSGFGKGVEALRQSRFGTAVKGAELVGQGVVWTAALISDVLALPEKIAHSAASKILAGVHKLEPFFPRIRALSERAKRWLLGCNSPCEVDIDGIVATLSTSSNAEVEALAALPRAKNVELVVEAPPASKVKEAGAVVPEEAAPATKPRAKKRLAEVRQEQANTLREERAGRLQVMAELTAHKSRLDRQLRAIIERLKNRNISAEERAVLHAERAQIREEIEEIGSLNDMGAEVEDLAYLTKNLSQEHYDRLTRIASARDEYQALRRMQADEVFGTSGGAMEIDHIYPRSRIYATPGFNALSLEDQIAIFNYRPNLRSMPQKINNKRRNTPYAEWSRAEWSEFPVIEPRHIRDLAAHEAKMQARIEAMIKDPKLIRQAWSP